MSAERRTIDRDLNTVLRALRQGFGTKHPRARIDGYRYYPEAIWIRIVDDSFAGKGLTQRDGPVWEMLEQHVPEPVLTQIGLLMLLTPAELTSSAMNQEFEHPHAQP
jgi:hypothetical protein